MCAPLRGLFELCRPRAMNSAVTISNAVAKESILGFFVQHSVGTPSLRPKRLASAFYLNGPILSGHANGSYGGAGTKAPRKRGRNPISAVPDPGTMRLNANIAAGEAADSLRARNRCPLSKPGRTRVRNRTKPLF